MFLLIIFLFGIVGGYIWGYLQGKKRGEILGLNKSPLLLIAQNLKRKECIICGKKINKGRNSCFNLEIKKRIEKRGGENMSNQQLNLQDKILNHVRRKDIPVVIYLMNGYQLQGKVIGFDNFTIILKTKEKDQVIYKHAISTIEPETDVGNIISNKSD